MAAVVGVSVAASLGGLRAADAAGLLPAGIEHAFPWANDGDETVRIDPRSIRKAVEVPGPDGQALVVWVGRSTSGQLCTSRVFVTTATADASRQRFRDQGGTCSSTGDDAFGATGGWGGGTGVEFTFAYTAGNAVRAEVRLPDGVVEPATVEGGWVVGWLPTGTYLGTTVRIIGFDAHGQRVGSVTALQ
jgi:hypothetical protein